MSQTEKKILNRVDRFLPLIVLLFFTVIGFYARFQLLDIKSSDMSCFLLPWYNTIKTSGIKSQVGDYNLLYQFIIFIMAKIPLDPVYLYKLLSIIFDYILAAGSALVIWHLSDRKALWPAIITYCAVLLSPIVILNSAAWGQCDSIYCCFIILTITALLKEKYPLAMVFCGLAFSFKLQAIFILPVLLFIYYTGRKFSILNFLIIPLTMVASGIPSMFCGRNPFDTFAVYANQTNTYLNMTMNYPSVWVFLTQTSNPEQYGYMHTVAIIITLAVLSILYIALINKKIVPEGKNVIFTAFITVFTCIIFLPAMHERYSYLYEVLAIILAVIKPKTIPLCAGIIFISMCTYGNYLFEANAIGLSTLAVINLLIYTVYLLLFMRDMNETKNT